MAEDDDDTDPAFASAPSTAPHAPAAAAGEEGTETVAAAMTSATKPTGTTATVATVATRLSKAKERRRKEFKVSSAGATSATTTTTLLKETTLTTRSLTYIGQCVESREISFDESVTGKITFWKDAPYVTLYIDDYTVMEEVTNLCDLRKGDHCIVGLNPVRKLCGCCDALVFYLASWEVLRLYHHFIMFDDVVSISEEGVPLNEHGEPARICEYSNTPMGALRLLIQVGWSKFFSDPAPFQQITLHDYQDGRSAFGIFRVLNDMDEWEREAIVSEASQLMTSFKPYHLFFRNCEHAAFGLDPNHRRWVSPQVPFLLYNLGRLFAHVLACLSLFELQRTRSVSEEWTNYTTLIVLTCHLFSTLPVALQVLVTLVRSTVLLTEQKKRLGEVTYFFLLTKEVARAVFAGGFAIALLALLPRFVWHYQYCWSAAYLNMTGYFLMDVLFNVSFRIATIFLNSHLTGIPVAVFASKRQLDRRKKPSYHLDTNNPRRFFNFNKRSLSTPNMNLTFSSDSSDNSSAIKSNARKKFDWSEFCEERPELKLAPESFVKKRNEDVKSKEISSMLRKRNKSVSRNIHR